MTFAQARAQAEKDLRIVRAIYRRADSLGEVFERNIDRLIKKRKTIVTPSQVMPLLARYEAYARQVVVLERALYTLNERLARFTVTG